MICDPKKLSRRELRHITRRFVAELGDTIGPHTDIPAPDVYTNAQTMAWIYDTYDRMHPGGNNLAVVTGKPLEIGGSVGRDEATARGCWNATEQLLRRGAVPGLHTLDGARVAIQGYGNAGSVAAKVFQNAGAKIVAISDSRGGIASEDGLDYAAVLEHKRATGSVVDFQKTQAISNAELLASECDILIPAALECQVTEANAGDVQARLIVEAANGPLTAGADRILSRNDVVVLPDILANAGGVVVSYFEWVQNLQNQKWNLDKVEQLLNDKMCRAVDETVDRCDDLRDRYENGFNADSTIPTLRDAALANAITRIATVIVQRDIWP